MQPSGYLCLVLHAHLPFVRHPEHEDFLEEDWLFEAVTECYAPLLMAVERLLDDGVPVKLAMSFTPPLTAMLDDPLLRARLDRYLDSRLDLAQREVERTKNDPAFAPAAAMYRDRFDAVKKYLRERCGGELLNGVRELARDGALEVLGCSATHAFLPLIQQRASQDAQVAAGIASHESFFGRPPAGIWLPECGYAPGVDEVLADHGVRFFFMETHGVLEGRPAPRSSREIRNVRSRSGAPPRAIPAIRSIAISTATSAGTWTWIRCGRSCILTARGRSRG